MPSVAEDLRSLLAEFIRAEGNVNRMTRWKLFAYELVTNSVYSWACGH